MAPAKKGAGAADGTPDQGAPDAAVPDVTQEDTSAPGSAPAAPPAPLLPASYYVARTDLWIGGLSGTMPVRAFNAGSRVPADLVEKNGWTNQVVHPDDLTQPAPAATTDATAAGQE
jgi:hypothetical protein